MPLLPTATAIVLPGSGNVFVDSFERVDDTSAGISDISEV